MAVRKIKPVTPGQRHKIAGTFDTHHKCYAGEILASTASENQEEGTLTAK